MILTFVLNVFNVHFFNQQFLFTSCLVHFSIVVCNRQKLSIGNCKKNLKLIKNLLTKMTALTEKIYDEAINLPIDERLFLVDKLLHSTNLPTQSEIDKAWAIEVELRDKQIDNGTAKLIPGEDVFNKIKNQFLK